MKKKSLVIVESPSKAKTISKILGSDYIIESSVGHIRDLPPHKIGVNTRKDFEPVYEILPGKDKLVAKLREAAGKSSFVYLATDPDREGEAIAWHLSEILKEDIPAKNMTRVMFNEITDKAVREAFKHPRPIDINRVAAQQARRVLDRLVGYKVSPLIQRRLGGRSAGRVQSVAVRLICEREEEIEAFQPEEYWTFAGELHKGKSSFKANLFTWQGKRIVNPDKADGKKNNCIRGSVEAQKLIEAFKPTQTLPVSSVQEKSITRNPSAPFITSTLQRTAASRYGFGVKKTMQVAQQLYEGIDIKSAGGTVGLITYMRTDSTRISDDAIEMAEEYIKKQFGEEYLPKERRQFSKKKSAQDAHEAIRPSYADKTPEKLKNDLSSDQYKLYKLIWERFLASQMASAKVNRITVEIHQAANDATLRASADKIAFPGYLAAFHGTDSDEDKDHDDDSVESLPVMKEGDKLELRAFIPNQHFTEPPPRFSEASLVKTLEELGIGRPSTYAAVIGTIQDRKYVSKLESKSLSPTKLGRDVNRILVENFGQYFESSYTALMESQLDEVERATKQWKVMIADFYTPFKAVLKEAEQNVGYHQTPTDVVCPKEGCGGMMMIKPGRFGPFMGCENYPTCTSTMKLDKDLKPLPPPAPTEVDCPKCNTKLNTAHGKYGEYLLCPNPDCAHKIALQKSTGIACPKEGCKGEIVEKKSRFGKLFYGCNEWSNTACDAVFWALPMNKQCPECKSLLVHKKLKKGDKLACSSKTCAYSEDYLEPVAAAEEAIPVLGV